MKYFYGKKYTDRSSSYWYFMETQRKDNTHMICEETLEMCPEFNCNHEEVLDLDFGKYQCKKCDIKMKPIKFEVANE